MPKMKPVKPYLTNEPLSNFVYALNKQGINRWSFAVQPGLDDEGNRTSPEELHTVALRAAKANELAEVANALLAYIDAIPKDAEQSWPAMPGVDRDWVENVLAVFNSEVAHDDYECEDNTFNTTL